MPDTILSSLTGDAVAVVVPLAVLTVALAAAWPRFRHRAGVLPMVSGLAALALVWSSDDQDLSLLPWVVVLAGAGVALGVVQVRQRRNHTPYRRMMGTAGRAFSRPVMALIVATAVVGVLGTSAQMARGDLLHDQPVSVARS